MSRRKNKRLKLDVETKPVWKASKGHSEHRSGSGSHNNKPKRLRTRNAQNREALREFDNDA